MYEFKMFVLLVGDVVYGAECIRLFGETLFWCDVLPLNPSRNASLGVMKKSQYSHNGSQIEVNCPWVYLVAV
jgi:hypothetical protein